MIVTSANEPSHSAPRHEMRSQNLWHRASFVFIANRKGEYLVQLRSLIKDNNPGFFDLVTGGVVGEGEGDEENAKREVEEEVGLKEVELVDCGKFKFEDERNRVWGNLYKCTVDFEPSSLKL